MPPSWRKASVNPDPPSGMVLPLRLKQVSNAEGGSALPAQSDKMGIEEAKAATTWDEYDGDDEMKGLCYYKSFCEFVFLLCRCLFLVMTAFLNYFYDVHKYGFMFRLSSSLLARSRQIIVAFAVKES